MNGTVDGLRAALPYLRLFKDKTFVIKLGGAVLADPTAIEQVADQVALLHEVGIELVIVHGGGAQASSLAERLGIPVQRIGGRRVTCRQTLEVVKMVFAGQLCTDLLAALRKSRVPAVGISGVDGGLLEARQRPPLTVSDPVNDDTQVDLGLVGEIEEVRPRLLLDLLISGYVPVVSALAGGDDGAVYNLNADTIAVRLAAALQAEKLILLTSVAGVLADPDDHLSLISHMDRARLEEILASTAVDGMKAKLEACRDALDLGVPRTHIISGLRADSLLAEVFTNQGCGTLIEQVVGAPGGGA